jgi:hypothetical protein
MKAVLASLVLIFYGLIYGNAASAQAGKPALKVGDKAPDFSLPNGDGKPVSLSELTAKGPVVLIFYRGYW